jgi:hypothetical protein
MGAMPTIGPRRQPPPASVDERPVEYLIGVNLSDFILGELTLRVIGPRPVARVERLERADTREPFASHKRREEPMQPVGADFAKHIVSHCLSGKHVKECRSATLD